MELKQLSSIKVRATALPRPHAMDSAAAADHGRTMPHATHGRASAPPPTWQYKRTITAVSQYSTLTLVLDFNPRREKNAKTRVQRSVGSQDRVETNEL